MRALECSQSKQPVVSVIMPSYNAEKYIAEAIKSVLAQTYSNWELLILDDGSTDRTAEIVQAFEAADRRISLRRNPGNMGVARTRNRGLDLAKGEWIALLDSDDIWHSNKIEKQMEKARRTGARIIYTSYSLFTDKPDGRRNYIVPACTNYESMLLENVIGCSTVMLHRSILEEHHFRDGIYHEDYALWLELLKSGYIAVGCSDVLVDWRVSQTSRSFNKWSAAGNRWMIYRKVEKLPFLKALRAFAVYMCHGIAKHKRL